MKYSIAYAKEVKAEVVLVHVLHVPAVDMYSPANVMSDMMDAQRKNSERRLENLCEEWSKDYECEIRFIVEFGFAADVIVEIAEKESASLICMGTNGKSLMISRLLGSVSYETCKRSHCPVLVIPQNVSFKNVNKVVLANDKSEHINTELKELFELFGHHIYRTDLITVCKGNEDYECRIVSEEGGIRSIEIEDQNPAVGIGHFLKANTVDLLVLKRQQRNFIEKVLHKSTIKQLLGESKTPMLILN